MTKYVYLFREGNASMKNTLGGKGANLAEMTRLGIPVPPGFTISTDACRVYLKTGETPAEAVSNCHVFPDLFTNQYNSGEVSGKLDETLRRLHQYYQEEGSRKLHAVSQWTPRIIYLIVALAIAYRIVSFYTNYFNQVGNVMKGF